MERCRVYPLECISWTGRSFFEVLEAIRLSAAGAERLGNKPGHLSVYLSNVCNLACSYCYVAVNQGPPARLSWPDLKGGIDTFLGESVESSRRVTFLGGEPLIDFPLLRQAVLYLRGEQPDISLAVFTNGTMLDRPKADFLLEQRVRVVVSLDGKAQTNDAARRFANGSGASVFAAISERLRELPVERLEVNMVFEPARVGRLADDVFFLHGLGFRSFGFYPDLYGDWTEAAVGRLRRALAVLSRRFLGRLGAGGAPPFVLRDLPLAAQRSENADWWRQCGNLVLGGDGAFYSCDKALSFPFDKAREASVGKVGRGVDWTAREEAHRVAGEEIDRLAPGQKFLHCPMGTHFHSRLSGRETGASVAAFARVNEALSAFYETLSARLRAHGEGFRGATAPRTATGEPGRPAASRRRR